MKYLLTAVRNTNNTQLLIDEVIPAKTSHIKGFGSGVTFTCKGCNWEQNATVNNLKQIEYSQPVVITQ